MNSTESLSAETESALAAVATYKEGSPRSALQPIDDAVASATSHSNLRNALEQRLVSALSHDCSAEAAEYICSKLAMIGSKQAVAALGQWLANEEVMPAALDALEKIRSGSALRILRTAAQTQNGPQQLGAILSLGRLRDSFATQQLRNLLSDSDGSVAAAAAVSLGMIGSVKCGEALRDYLPHAPSGIRNDVANAALECAEHLMDANQTSEARAMFAAVAAGPFAAHLRAAAQSRCAK